MNPSDPLAQLRDIHLPEAISWWPLAPGWWFLAIVFIVAMAYFIGLLWQRHHAFTYRREALLLIKQLPYQNQQQRITALLALLKQVAGSAYPEFNLTSLNNAEFIAFLKQTYPKAGFERLTDNWHGLFYAKDFNVPVAMVDQLERASTQWIKHHPLAKNIKGYTHA